MRMLASAVMPATAVIMLLIIICQQTPHCTVDTCEGERHTHLICRASPRLCLVLAACSSLFALRQGRCHQSRECLAQFRRVRWLRAHIRLGRGGLRGRRWLFDCEGKHISISITNISIRCSLTYHIVSTSLWYCDCVVKFGKKEVDATRWPIKVVRCSHDEVHLQRV